MERCIKYRRFEYNKISPDELQKNFDDLISNGWDIIYYNEERTPVHDVEISLLVVIVAGKKQDNTLS